MGILAPGERRSLVTFSGSGSHVKKKKSSLKQSLFTLQVSLPLGARQRRPCVYTLNWMFRLLVWTQGRLICTFNAFKEAGWGGVLMFGSKTEIPFSAESTVSSFE